MKPLDLFLFGWGSLWGHHLRTALSIVGVAIGVTAVLLLTALGEGARGYVTQQLEDLGATFIVILPGKVETSGAVPFVGGVVHDLTLEDAEALQRQVFGIRRIAPLALGEATVAYGSLHRTSTVVGSTGEFFVLRRLAVAQGSPLPSGEMTRGSAVCVIGRTVAQELFQGENPLGRILNVGESRFRVIGILAPKGESIGINFDEMVILPVSSVLKIFNQTSLFRVFVEGTAPSGLEILKKEIIKVIRQRHKGDEDVTLVTQDAMLAGFNKILNALTMALVGIAAISLTVAGVSIMNVMLVSVSERTSEIGLLKAVGVGSGQIVAVFLSEAALLSSIGGIAGLILSQVLVGVLRGVFPVLPLAIPIWAVSLSMAVAVGIGILFGVWPARRASKLDPVIALTKK
jgi:putative ABC transport system permease protein